MRTLFKSTLMLLFMLPMSFFAQQTVSGTVTEEATGLPIPGVNIVIKGTNTGTTTDFDGNYTVSNITENQILVFSFLGFERQEIRYQGQNTLNVVLNESQAALEEVVLIGYGSSTQRDATGAISKIKPEQFNEGGIISPEQLISGKTAGVRITPSSQPGGGSEIRIRGGSSLAANNSPLIVVDGFPLDQRGVQGVRNQLNSINPNEIEDFVILKDAAATAIYGSRASNGVILITTKKGGLNSDFSVGYNLQTSVGKITTKANVLTAQQFRDLINATPGADPSLLGNSNTDWQDEIYQYSVGAIHDLTFSQGYDNFSYRVNLNHTDQTGVLKTDFYQRNAVNITLAQNLFDNNLKITLNSKGIHDRNKFADQGAIGAAVAFDPTQPVFDPDSPFDGFFEFRNGNTTDDEFRLAPRNPVALLEQRENNAENFRNITNVNLDYRFHFFPDLRFVVNAGVDYADLEGFERRPLTSAVNAGDVPLRNNFAGINRNQLLDVYFNYKTSFEALNLNTNLDVTAGHSYQEFFSSSQSSFIQSNELQNPPRSINRNALESYFARASLDIADRYLISASFRYDGSSRFSEANDNRWADFPAVSVGWKIINEEFMRDSNTFSNLKLRAGFGITGNNEIGRNYGFLGTFTPSRNGASIQFGDEFVPTIRPEGFDENLKWEELRTYNAGLDIGFFNERLTANVDAYYRETQDLLAFVPVPAGANLTDLLTTNVGETVSKGIEVGLDAVLVRNNNFNWNFNYNITFQDLEITKLSLGNNPNFFIPQGGISGGVGNFIQLWKEGFDPTTFFVFRQVYDPQGRPIEGAYVDVNGDNRITEADRQPYKKATPDYFMGFTNTLTYKNLDFSFTLRGNFNQYVYNNTQSSSGFVASGTNTPQAFFSNMNNDVLESNFQNSQFFSDYYITGADFVRLDNVSLSYLVPGEVIDFRASLTGTNLFTIDNYEGLDPEIGGGIDNNFYPRSRTVTLGLNFLF